MSRVPGILPRMHQAPRSGQHREPPGGVFLLGFTGHTHWWEKGSPTEGTSGRGLGEGLGGEGLQVQEGGSTWQGGWGGGIEGWGKQAEGAAAELPARLLPVSGTEESWQQGLGGRGQELGRGTEPQVSKHQSFPPSALDPWHQEGDGVRT